MNTYTGCEAIDTLNEDSVFQSLQQVDLLENAYGSMGAPRHQYTQAFDNLFSYNSNSIQVQHPTSYQALPNPLLPIQTASYPETSYADTASNVSTPQSTDGNKNLGDMKDSKDTKDSKVTDEEIKARARDRARKSRKRKLEKMEQLEEQTKTLSTENIRLKEQNDLLLKRVEQMEEALRKKPTVEKDPVILPSIRDNPATPAELKARHQMIVHFTKMIKINDFSKLEEVIHPHCIVFNPGHEWEVYTIEGIQTFYQSFRKSFDAFEVVDAEIQPLDQFGDKFRNRWTISGTIREATPGCTLQEKYLYQRAQGQRITFSGTSIYFFRRNQIIMIYRTWNPIALMLHIMQLGTKTTESNAEFK